MSWINADCWPVGCWTPGDGIEVLGWPDEITDAVTMTGFPAIEVPVTIADAEIFHLRPVTATFNLNIAFGPGSVMIPVPMVRYQDCDVTTGIPTGLLIAQDEEELLIPGEPDEYVFRPSWLADLPPTPLGTDGDFVSANFYFHTEQIWLDHTLNIAFFNIRMHGTATLRLGEPSAPEEITFFWDEQPPTPPYDFPGPPGQLDILGGTMPLVSGKLDAAMPDYDFFLDGFTPTVYFRYAKQGGTNPTYDETTGEQLHSPLGPDGR